MHVLKPTSSSTPRRYRQAFVGALVCSLWSSLLLAQQPLDPLSVSEAEQAKTVFLRDANVQKKLGGKTRFRILSVERHEYPKNETLTAERAANITAYNYNTDEAISAVVGLGSKAVNNLLATTTLQPSLSPEELAEARQLATADPFVQAKLSSAGVSAADTDSFIVTHLFVRDMEKGHSCATHRCVVLFFNTQDAVLDVTPVVDLSARSVEVR